MFQSHNLLLCAVYSNFPKSDWRWRCNAKFYHQGSLSFKFCQISAIHCQLYKLNKNIHLASQCGYVVSASASRQGDPGSNPIAARKSCEVYPGLGILQPQP